MDKKALLKTLVNSIYAGGCIALGGIAYLSCENKIVGAFLFSIGLLAVLIFGFDLFTGKVCYIDSYKKPLNLLTVFIGNYIGAGGVGLIMATHGTLAQKVADICIAKADKTPLTLLIDAFICGICIAIAVKGYRKAEGFGKYIAVVLGVMCFILVGSEHIVANMFYFTLGHNIEFGRIIMFFLINAVGNMIGGALFFRVE